MRKNWLGRDLQGLSDAELIGFMCLWRIPGLFDILEQFPLSQDANKHVLSRYDRSYASLAPGTIAVANSLSISHPEFTDKFEKHTWIMTTDGVAVYEAQNQRNTLALSVKREHTLSKRTLEKLKIEEVFWANHHTPWFLLNVCEIPPEVVESVHKIAQAVLPYRPPSEQTIQKALTCCGRVFEVPLTQTVQEISEEVELELFDADCLLMQLIWLGHLSVDTGSDFLRGGHLLPAHTRNSWDPIWTYFHG